MAQRIILVLARADNGVIGRDGGLPWRLPADLAHFKRVTMGKPMIMGRRTFESLPGLLPGRRHIVLTRDASWWQGAGEVVSDVASALALAGPSEVAVIGGAEIFSLFEPLADGIELTEVHGDIAGDTRVAPLGPQWCETVREDHPAAGDAPAFSFVTFARR